MNINLSLFLTWKPTLVNLKQCCSKKSVPRVLPTKGENNGLGKNINQLLFSSAGWVFVFFSKHKAILHRSSLTLIYILVQALYLITHS